jgi:glycine oxidase
LARRGEDVVVLERDRVGAGAGGVAAGMLAQASEAEHGSDALIRLAQDSVRRYPEWAAAVERAGGGRCGLRREGTLLVALGRDDEDELVRIAHFQQRYGVATSWLTADQVLEIEPQISPRVTAGLSAPGDHQVDAQALLAGLARAVTALGGRIAEGARVTGFGTARRRLRCVTGRYSGDGNGDGGSFAVRCEMAVLAAGAWSGVGMEWPAAPLGVRPVKGQLVHLHGPDLIQRVVRSPHVYLVPRAGGALVVGATMEEQGFDRRHTAGAVMDLLWNARLVVPGVYDLALADVRVGFRPATRDHEPVIGETGVAGLYVATGHFRHGVLLAPGTAALLADQILGRGTSPLIAPFAPKQAAQEAADAG